MGKLLTYGGFDVIGVDHIELFKQAKSLGDELVVALAGDNLGNWERSVAHRQAILEALIYVDKVIVIQDENQLKELMTTYQIQEVLISDQDQQIIAHLKKVCPMSVLEF